MHTDATARPYLSITDATRRDKISASGIPLSPLTPLTSDGLRFFSETCITKSLAMFFGKVGWIKAFDFSSWSRFRYWPDCGVCFGHTGLFAANRHGELKYGAAWLICAGPYPPAVGLYKRPADRQSH